MIVLFRAKNVLHEITRRVTWDGRAASPFAAAARNGMRALPTRKRRSECKIQVILTQVSDVAKKIVNDDFNGVVLDPCREETMTVIIDVVKHALMITSFVFVMMLAIEYLNVLTRGDWGKRVRGHRWAQYFLAGFLGATPGCLGTFAIVSLYTHRVITAGALVAVMIATSGDESFVMLVKFPGKAMLLFGILLVLGIIFGAVVDLFCGYRRSAQNLPCDSTLIIHEEARCDCFSKEQILAQWQHCSLYRGALSFFLVLFLLGILSGEIGQAESGWIRGTLLFSAMIGLFIISTVPDHFLEDHLWNHVAKQHIWRIFLWTLCTLLVMHILVVEYDLEVWVREGNFSLLVLLVIACLVGIIPESGPHLIFVMLFAEGKVPFSILLASSIVQDGHGMLPVLAHSRRAFFAVKAVKFVIGLFAGLLGFFMGW